MPKEIVVDWTTANGPGKVSVFFFGVTPLIANQRSALSTWLTAVRGSLVSTTSYSIRTSGRTLDDATGALVGSWSEPTGYAASGSVVAQGVPDATQVLSQWRTGAIVGGRYLRGRTFIPGLAVSQVSNGNLIAAQVTGLQNAGNTLVASGNELGVWRRPVRDPITHVVTRPGVFNVASSCTVWPELAVLRRRRY